MITKIVFEKFTAFDELTVDCSSGINVFVGANGTGKTHILKTVYSATEITKSRRDFADKICRVFSPSNDKIGRLIRRAKVSTNGYVEVHRKVLKEDIRIRLTCSNHTKLPVKARVSGTPKKWIEYPMESVYIPVKEMLANAPGFRSLYATRQLAFEEVYIDIIDRALLPIMKGPTDHQRRNVLEILRREMDGKIQCDNEEFFLRNKQGKFEFTLLAEGIRKLGLIWVLIQNGTLLNGSVLCWDEPEANLNPKLLKTIVAILLQLQKLGVQIFISTHNYVILKEFDLQMQESNQVKFHALYHEAGTKEIALKSTLNYADIEPNAIDETFSDLINRDLKRSMGDWGQ